MATKIYDAETQFLTIAYAKDVGLDRQQRVVAFDANEKSREAAGLTALLVYSVVAPAYSFYSRLLVDASSPVSISSFLARAWSEEASFGIPYSLEVKQQVLTADRGYAAWIRSHGVELVPPSSIKSLISFERSSLDVRFDIQWRIGNSGDSHPKLEQANASMQHYDTWSMLGRWRNSMEEYTFEAWRARDRRFFVGKPLETDWDAAVLVEKVKQLPSAELIVHEGDDPVNFVDGIKEISVMWPGGRRAFFGAMKINRKEFDFWVAGRANLHHSDFAQIKELANIDYSHGCDEWLLLGGYLLIATTPRVAISTYETLSHGGDLQFSFEILGPDGELPALRFLVFRSWGGVANIILFERGSSAEMALNDRKLINLQKAVHAPPDIWETVNMIVDYRQKFKKPGKIGAEFSAQYEEWLDKMDRS